jgi:hypothetical protein
MPIRPKIDSTISAMSLMEGPGLARRAGRTVYTRASCRSRAPG